MIIQIIYMLALASPTPLDKAETSTIGAIGCSARQCYMYREAALNFRFSVERCKANLHACDAARFELQNGLDEVVRILTSTPTAVPVAVADTSAPAVEDDDEWTPWLIAAGFVAGAIAGSAATIAIVEAVHGETQ